MATSGRKKWVRLRQRLTGESHAEFFAGEYDLLRKDKRIDTLQVQSGVIMLTTSHVIWEGRVDMDSGRYWTKIFLGRYGVEIYYAGGTPSMRIWCIESGRHDKKPVRPNLFPNNESYPFGFCFGQRRAFVTQLLRQGEPYALICEVLDSLWFLNPGLRKHDTVGEYRSVLPNGIIEPPLTPKRKAT